MLRTLYQKAQYLSLDIVAGAIILLHFFAQQLEAEVSLFAYVLLGGSVWLIYTLDHLKDAKLAFNSGRERYQFHLENEKWLKIMMILVVIICVYGVFQIDHNLLLTGSLLALLSVLYLLTHSILSKKGIKESYVALIYTLGILIAPFTYSGTVQWSLVWLLFLLTLSNLILFSWYEKEEDKMDSFYSIATVLNGKVLERIILILLSLGLASTLLIGFSMLTVYFLVAFSIYSFLFTHPNWSRERLRYRAIGDGVFMLPILFMWV